MRTTEHQSAKPDWEFVECNLCGNESGTIVFETQIIDGGESHRAKLIECKACDLVYLNPRPTGDTISRFYQENYEPHRVSTVARGLTWRVQRAAFRVDAAPWRRRLTALLRFTINTLGTRPLLLGNPGDRLIDVGCATGRHLLLYHDLGWDIQGVESDPKCCSMIRETLQLPVIEGSWFDAETEAGSVQAIIFWHVLEHLHDPRAALRKAFATLAPGGTLQLSVPTCDGVGFTTFRESWAALELPRHLFFFSRSALRRLLEEVGFTDIRTRTLWRESFLVWKRSRQNKKQRVGPVDLLRRLCPGGDVLLTEARKPNP
jgi:2-polyprenyl-3-methyl-5-hydroxy-6-metoxy-1,4-benzoquinol methylase